MPMRILLLTTYFEPDVASGGVLMAHLARELVKLGHHLTVVTSMPHYDRNRIWPKYRWRLRTTERCDGFRVHRVYLYVPAAKSSLAGRLLNYASFNTLSVIDAVLTGRYDVVLTPSPPLTNGLSAYILSRLRRVPYVYNVQDLYPDVAVRLGVLTNRKAIAVFTRLEQFIYSKAAAITVISRGLRTHLLRKGVPAEKIWLIPNFVDSSFVRPLERHNGFRHSMRFENSFVVLFAGNVGLSQGLESVLKMARLISDRQDIVILIVGEGAAKEGLVRLAREMGLSNVRFLPFQAAERVPDVYASSDLCLVTLKRGIAQSSVPSKVYTIMAAERPILAAVDEGSDTWELVLKTGCGICVPPEEPLLMSQAVLKLYQERRLSEEMGRRGRMAVENRFTPQAAAQSYASLLHVVTSRKLA